MASLGNLAEIYQRIGQPDSALVLYRLALADDQQQVNRQRTVNRLTSIGGVYLDGDYPDSALVYHRRALAVAREMDGPLAEASPLHSIGITCAVLAQSDSAVYYRERAAAIWRALDRKQSLAAVLANLAVQRSKATIDDSVFALLRESLALNRRIQDEKGEGVVRQYLAAALVATSRPIPPCEAARRCDSSVRFDIGHSRGARSLPLPRQLALNRRPARSYYNEALRVMRDAGSTTRSVRAVLAEMAELLRSGPGVHDLTRATRRTTTRQPPSATTRAAAPAAISTRCLCSRPRRTSSAGGRARGWGAPGRSDLQEVR